jgi:hypothetical protein
VAIDRTGNALFAWERELADRSLIEAIPKPSSGGFGSAPSCL